MARHFPGCKAHARRDFLRIGTAGLFGLGLPQLLELEARAHAASPARERRAQSVIFVWLSGGPPTIDMWDLKPHAPDGIRGEFRSIATRAGGVQICEHLPRMAAVMDQCTLVRSLGHTIPEHGLATTFMTTGNRPTPVLRYPNLGSLVARLSATPPGAAPFVAVRAPGGQALGDVAGYLGPAYDPFELEVTRPGPTSDAVVDTRGVVLPADFPVAQLDHRNALAQSFDHAFDAADRNPELAKALDTFDHQALDILRSNKTRDALNLGRERRAVRERYGPTEFGQGCLAARRLIEAGVRFVTVRSGFTWDTHTQNFSILRAQNLPQLDQALSALIHDLHDHGLLEGTIVYCAGEFGRTPRINASAGRDHWARSMAVVLAGGGFKRGFVYGSTDAQGMAPATDPCTPDDIAATILHQLGIDPRQELQTPTARPVQLFREGHVLGDLVG